MLLVRLISYPALSPFSRLINLFLAPPPAIGEPWCPTGCQTRLHPILNFREFDSNEYTLPHMVQCPRRDGRLEDGYAVRVGTGNPLAEKLPGMHPLFRRAHVFVFVPVREGGPERRMRRHFLLDEDPSQRVHLPHPMLAQVPNPKWLILNPPFAYAPVDVNWNLIIKYAFIGDRSPIGHAAKEGELYRGLGLAPAVESEPEPEPESEFVDIDKVISG